MAAIACLIITLWCLLGFTPRSLICLSSSATTGPFFSSLLKLINRTSLSWISIKKHLIQLCSLHLCLHNLKQLSWNYVNFLCKRHISAEIVNWNVHYFHSPWVWMKIRCKRLIDILAAILCSSSSICPQSWLRFIAVTISLSGAKRTLACWQKWESLIHAV